MKLPRWSATVLVGALMFATSFPVQVAHAAATTITGVSSTTNNATYGVGSPAISIQVNFSAAVDVAGTPTLELATNGVNQGQLATYASGTGTTALTFSYTVQPTDFSADLDYRATNSLALPNGAHNIK